jgi:hypothetical protein
MLPGWTAGAKAGRAAERTGIGGAGLPVRASARRRAERGGRAAPGGRGRWLLGAGAVDRTGRRLHYREMESGASQAASAPARRPARSGSDIPPPPSIARLAPADNAV